VSRRLGPLDAREIAIVLDAALHLKIGDTLHAAELVLAYLRARHDVTLESRVLERESAMPPAEPWCPEPGLKGDWKPEER